MEKQFRVIHDALISGFTRPELKVLVKGTLDQHLDAIAGGTTLSEIIFELIEWCVRSGKISELIQGAHELRPDNLEVAALIESGLELPDVIPYPGLVSFTSENSEYYYGRDKSIAELLSKLNSTSFVTVVGNSGCGKSSLVRAGLISRLNKDNHNDWKHIVFRPGEQPLEELQWELKDLFSQCFPLESEQLLSARQRNLQQEEIKKLFVGEDKRAADALKQISKILCVPTNFRLLVVVDQFEELFVYEQSNVPEAENSHSQPPTNHARRFIEEILALRNVPWVKVAITLRSDFYGRVLREPDLNYSVSKGQVNVLEMSVQELRSAVEEPAKSCGRHFESGLVEQIITDIGGSPSQLPLLQVALQRLWQSDSKTGVLTRSTYDEISGVAGALAQRAERIYANLSTDEQDAARSLCLQLIHVAMPHDERGDTRRRLIITEQLDEATRNVIEQFADESVRLLVLGVDRLDKRRTVELAHEALIYAWPTLEKWLHDYRPFLEWREEVRVRMNTWQHTDNPDDVLRGTLLDNSQQYVDDFSSELTKNERRYIAISKQRYLEEFDQLQNVQMLEKALEETRGTLATRTAVAWLGNERAAWQHNLIGHVATIENYVKLLEKDLERESSRDKLQQRLIKMRVVINKIREVKITAPLSPEQGREPVFIDPFLKQWSEKLNWDPEIFHAAVLELQLNCLGAYIQVNRVWFKLALDNLANNALRAMERAEIKKLIIKTSIIDNMVEILFSDTGSGIPAKIRTKMFKGSVPRMNNGQGEGIGLLLTTTIVETYGGQIGVLATGLTGTSIYIRMPCQHEVKDYTI